MSKEDNKFTWGEAVYVKQDAPEPYRPGEFASICGMDRITNQAEADSFECKSGDWVYLIEYADGSSREVAERFLETDSSSS